MKRGAESIGDAISKRVCTRLRERKRRTCGDTADGTLQPPKRRAPDTNVSSSDYYDELQKGRVEGYNDGLQKGRPEGYEDAIRTVEARVPVVLAEIQASLQQVDELVSRGFMGWSPTVVGTA